MGEGGRGGRFVERRVRVLLLLFWMPAMFSVVPEAPAAPYADALGAGSPGLGLLMCALPVCTVAGELFLRPAACGLRSAVCGPWAGSGSRCRWSAARCS
ncbi:hypothetical protein ACWCQN_27755 [Streptomyces sp. NPDC001984]